MLVAFHLSRVCACIFSIVVLRLPSVLPVTWQLEQVVPFINIVAFTLKECPFTFWLSGSKLPFESVIIVDMWQSMHSKFNTCLLYTSDAADDLLCVDLGGRRIIKK